MFDLTSDLMKCKMSGEILAETIKALDELWGVENSMVSAWISCLKGALGTCDPETINKLTELLYEFAVETRNKLLGAYGRQGKEYVN